MNIEERLTCRHTIRVLHKAGIETMEALARLSREDLLKLHGIGPIIAADVEKIICEWKQDEKQPILGQTEIPHSPFPIPNYS